MQKILRQFRKWKVRDKVVTLPASWSIDKVILKLNEPRLSEVIRVCDICGKVDIDYWTHYETCNAEAEALRQENLNQYYD